MLKKIKKIGKVDLYLEKLGAIGQSTNPLHILQKIGDSRLSKMYQQLFPVPVNESQPGQVMLDLVQVCWNLKQQAYGEIT